MIRGKLVSLTLVRRKHLDELYELTMTLDNRGPHFPLTLTGEPRFRSAFEETGFWGDDFGRMLILREEDVIGSVWYFKTAPYSDALELGYIVFGEANRGKGVMTEAVSLFVAHLFATRKLNRIEVRILPENGASIRVAEKVGFHQEGCMRGAYFQDGEHKNLLLYSILRTDVRFGQS